MKNDATPVMTGVVIRGGDGFKEKKMGGVTIMTAKKKPLGDALNDKLNKFALPGKQPLKGGDLLKKLMKKPTINIRADAASPRESDP